MTLYPDTLRQALFLAECRKGPSSAQSCSSFTCQISQSLWNRTPAHCSPDDTLVYSTCCTPSRHPCCNLQEDIDAVQNLVFGLERYFQLELCQKPTDGCWQEWLWNRQKLCPGGDKLQQVCTVSHLGLTLASTLKWSDHVSGILKRAAPKAAALKKLGYRARVGVDTMSLLYKTILRPCLEYANISLG